MTSRVEGSADLCLQKGETGPKLNRDKNQKQLQRSEEKQTNLLNMVLECKIIHYNIIRIEANKSNIMREYLKAVGLTAVLRRCVLL